MKTKNKTIIALTTDPYDNIYGYSLVFMRLMDYIQKKHTELAVVLYSNDGVSSKKLANKTFTRLILNPNSSRFYKTILLSLLFITRSLPYPKESIILVNCEIPELLAGWFLKLKYKKVFCLIQDTRVRDDSLSTRVICAARIFLLKRIGKIIFTNKFTLNTFKGDVQRFYIGNPIFN